MLSAPALAIDAYEEAVSVLFSLAAVCPSLCAENSRESLLGSVKSGRKRSSQIEQAYSPVHTRFPFRSVITAVRKIRLSGTLKVYNDSRSARIAAQPHTAPLNGDPSIFS